MPAAVPLVGPRELGQIVGDIAASPHQWQPVVRYCADHRWYYRLDPVGPDAAYEIWLLSWLPGQQTGFHDHGDAVGAFALADGELAETTGRPGTARTGRRVLAAGAGRTFGREHLHNVSNDSARPAVSVHAYSPPLSLMRRYEMTGSGLALSRTETAEADW